jgi:hypothetical protein
MTRELTAITAPARAPASRGMRRRFPRRLRLSSRRKAKRAPETAVSTRYAPALVAIQRAHRWVRAGGDAGTDVRAGRGRPSSASLSPAADQPDVAPVRG